MSTSIAVSSAALAAANAARTAAQKARCEAQMPVYQHTTATVEQQQGYAQCVRLLHPEELTGGAVLMVKVFIVIALIGAVVGWVREEYGDWTDKALCALMGLIGAPVAAGILLGIGVAVVYLFTGG